MVHLGYIAIGGLQSRNMQANSFIDKYTHRASRWPQASVESCLNKQSAYFLAPIVERAGTPDRSSDRIKAQLKAFDFFRNLNSFHSSYSTNQLNMFFKLAVILFAATSIAASTVPVGRQVSDAATCTLVLDPQSPVSSSTNLEAEFNLRTYTYDSSND